jgi:hypothetical protein
MKTLLKVNFLYAALTSIFTVIPSFAAERTSNSYQAPTNELGQPDLRGVWNFSSDISLERPKEFLDNEFLTPEDIATLNENREKMFDRALNAGVGVHNKFWLDYKSHVENLRSSLIVYPKNGLMPPLVDGVVRNNPAFGIGTDIVQTRPVRFLFGGIGLDGPEDRGLFERCVFGNAGPPISPSGDNNFLQIFQTKDHVVILVEHIHDARIIPLDSGPPRDNSLRHWSGDSRGYWQEDSLVIETHNFTDKTQSFYDAGTAYHKKVTERITRVADNLLHYRATVEDPHTFKDKVEILLPMAKFDGEVYEFACHEGNYSMENSLAGARKEEQEAATKPD